MRLQEGTKTKMRRIEDRCIGISAPSERPGKLDSVKQRIAIANETLALSRREKKARSSSALQLVPEADRAMLGVTGTEEDVKTAHALEPPSGDTGTEVGRGHSVGGLEPEAQLGEKEAAVRLESIATSLVVAEAVVAAVLLAEHGMTIGIEEAPETMTDVMTASAPAKPTSSIGTGIGTESETETETVTLTGGEATGPSL